MIQSPIHRALLIFRNCNVRFLVMGGQACILYGGAEFSRDLDLSIGIDAGNLVALPEALDQLERLLFEEERLEKAADQEYWRPLREELEQWRRTRER